MTTNTPDCCRKCLAWNLLPTTGGEPAVPICKNPSCECHSKPDMKPSSTHAHNIERLRDKENASIPDMKEVPYNEIDHSHCWNQKKPACGQKIEHLKCCLCEKLNPKVLPRTEVARVIEELKERAVCKEHKTDNILMCRECVKVVYYRASLSDLKDRLKL